MESLFRDLRVGLRQLLRDKGFSLAAILTLALGMGAAGAIFTILDAVLLKELPYRDPERLVVLRGSFEDKGEAQVWPISQTDFKDWRERSTLFSDMSVWASNLALNLEQGQQSQRLEGELVNDRYFALLGLTPQVGRFFTAEEDAKPLERFVVVLADPLWRKSFGADPGVLGRKLQMNGVAYQVVGVAPPGFRGLSDAADVWVPSMLPPNRRFLTNRSTRWAAGVARLKPGVSLRQAQQEMNGITAALAQDFPDTNRGLGATVIPIQQFWFGELQSGLTTLAVGAGILLLIACINVASLLLTRAIAQQRAWTIRVALGASRRQLARQMIVESLLLSLFGTACGLVFAQWAIRVLIASSGTKFPGFVRIAVGPTVAGWGLALAVLCGLVFGLTPIAVSLRSDLSGSLGRDDKLPPLRRGWQHFQSAVVVAQVALALTLAVGTALSAKSYRRLIDQDLGFRAPDLLTYRIDLRGPRYAEDSRVVTLLRQVYLTRVTAVPGVRQLAMSDPAIPTDTPSGSDVTIEDHDSDRPQGTYLTMIHAVSPDYFGLLHVPVVKGRAFTPQDFDSNAAVVSRTLAERQWPGQDPVGKRLKLGARNAPDVPWLTVVGVVGDVRYEGYREGRMKAPDLYVSLLQFIRRPPLTVNFLVRPQGGLADAQLRSALHREMQSIDPELPDYDVATLAERLAAQTAKARFQVVLVTVYSVLALLLAAVGIYGVVSYGMAQRRGEIAIRMSLGADRGRIQVMVLRRGALLALAGLALGLAAIVSLRPLLPGLAALADPWILGGASLGLFLVALAANLLPARRAAKVDPIANLRAP